MARNKHPEETVNLILNAGLKLFIEKGYEGTSVQDIINHLGGLSKGAIYHHFKSKEEIFEAVCGKIEVENSVYFETIRDDESKNGYEKLKTMLGSVYINPANDAMIALLGKIMSDPKFLSNYIFEIYGQIVPKYVQPVIEQGVRDGSIKTDYPEELAAVIITLTNIWINPIIVKSTAAQMRNKLMFFSLLLKGIGVDIIGEDTINQYVSLGQRFEKKL